MNVYESIDEIPTFYEHNLVNLDIVRRGNQIIELHRKNGEKTYMPFDLRNYVITVKVNYVKKIIEFIRNKKSILKV